MGTRALWGAHWAMDAERPQRGSHAERTEPASILHEFNGSAGKSPLQSEMNNPLYC